MCRRVESLFESSGVTLWRKSFTFEKTDIFSVIGEVISLSELSFQLTFIDKESFPTGIDIPNSSARFTTDSTPLIKSPLSSGNFVELIQFAEKVKWSMES